jgi:hypothetical protein
LPGSLRILSLDWTLQLTPVGSVCQREQWSDARRALDLLVEDWIHWERGAWSPTPRYAPVEPAKYVIQHAPQSLEVLEILIVKASV